jgi:hypothetical protein
VLLSLEAKNSQLWRVFIISIMNNHYASGGHPEFFLGGGADPEAIYNLCLTLNLCYKDQVVSAT